MIMRRWPLHPIPVEEEALSSWLGRVAANYNLSLDDILKYDLGYEISTDDLDLNPPVTLLEKISHRSHLSLDQIHRMTFRSWVPFIIDQLEPSLDVFDTYTLQYPVLLPVKHRRSHVSTHWRPWLSNPPIIRACQSCINLEPKNIIRLPWKLPIMITCPLHGCRLQTCMSYSSEYVCWKEEETVDLPVTNAILNMDNRTWQALVKGKVDLPRRSIHAGIWFRLLRSLLNELSLPLSRYPAHAHNIKEVWNTCGHPVRASLNIWKSYEYLPLRIQVKLLEAAATAISMIEEKSLNISGEYSKLFQAELIDEDDLPSGLEAHTYKSPGLSLNELFDQAVAEAKVNRESAQGLRALYLFGRNDPELIKEIDNILLDLGIPFEFL